MKKIIIFIFCILCMIQLSAQTGCPGCITDNSFSTSDGMPGVNTTSFPEACVNQYYEQDATLYLPGSFNYSGLDVTLVSVTVTRVNNVPPGLNWTKNGGGSTWNVNGNTQRGCFRLCGTPTTAGSYNIEIVVSGTGRVGLISMSQDMTFNFSFVVNPAPGNAGSITGPTTACRGQSGFQYTVPAISGAASYQWSYSGTGATLSGTGNTVNISFSSSATTGNLTVRGINGQCTGGTSPGFFINLGNSPSAAGTISGPSPVCQGQSGIYYSVPYIINATSHVWSYSGTGVTIGGNTSNVPLTFSASATSGNLTVYGSNTCGNGTVSASFPIIVNPMPAAAGVISGSSHVCPGQSLSFSIPAIANANSYVWSYSGTGATINGNSRNITIDFASGATSGNLTVKGRNTCGDGTLSPTFPIAIDPLPGVAGTITGSTTICQRQTGIAYSVPAVANATSYTWNFSGQGVTIHGTGNSITADFSTNASSGAFYVAGHNNCGDGPPSSSLSVIVNPVPTQGTVSGTQIACQGSTGVTYAVNDVYYATSYQWSYTGTGVTIHGSGTAVTLDFATNATSGNLVVKGQNSCGNGVETIYPVTVITLPASAGNISGPAVACQGQTGVTYQVDSILNAYSYVWEYSGTGAGIMGNGKIVTVNFSPNATSGTLKVKGRNACGDGTFSAAFPVTVNLLPAAAGLVTGLPVVCQGQDSVAFHIDAIQDADSYSWSYSGNGVTIIGNGQDITMDFARNATPGNVTVRGQNACGLGVASSVYTVNLSPLPGQPAGITGPAIICQGQAASFSVATIPNTDSYFWDYTGTGATINGTGRSVSVSFSTGATSGILTVMGHNDCGNGNESGMNITLTTLPTFPAGITGTPSVCQGASGIQFHIDSVPYATSYLWEFSGANVSINGTERDVSIDFGRNSTSGILSVKGQNLCGIGSPSEDYNIIIRPLPSTPAAIDGEPLICQGQQGVIYTVPVVSDADSYIWTYSGGGMQVNGDSNQVSIDFETNITAGNLTVQGMNGCGLGNISSPYYLGVNLLPGTPLAITGITETCQGMNGIAYSVPQVANAQSYVWEYSGTGVTVNGTGTNVTIDFDAGATSGILTVKGYNNNCGEGAPSEGLPISILTSLPLTPGVISGNSVACQGENNVVFTVDTVANAQTYIWSYSGSGASISGNGNTVSVNFSPSATSGLLTVKGANTCGFGAGSPPLNITVDQLPAFAGFITGTTYLCQGQSNVSYQVNHVQDADSYTWMFSGTGATVNGTGNQVTISFAPNATSGNLTVAGHNDCGDGLPSLNFPIYFFPLPEAAGMIYGDTELCAGQGNITYSVQGVSNADYYIWSYTGTGAGINGTGTIADISFTGNATSGYLSVRGANSCGEGDESTPLFVHVETIPLTPGAVSGSDTVCPGQTDVMYYVPPISNARSYLWSYSGTGATLSGNGDTLLISFGSTATSGNLTVKGVNICGLGSTSAPFHITLNDIPGQAGAISGMQVVCQGTNDVPYAVPAIQRATQYQWSYTGSGGNIFGNSDSIYVNFMTNSTSGNLMVYGSNSCGNGPLSSAFPVTVNPLPAPAVEITGPDNVCQGAREVEFITNPILYSTTYEWIYSGSGAHINNAGTHAYITFDSVATTGTLMVYGHNDCGDGGPATFQVTLRQTPFRPVITYENDTLWSSVTNGIQWYSVSSGLIPGATQPYYIPLENGGYYALATSNGCTSDTSFIFNVMHIGIFDIHDELIKVYPDPVRDELNISFKNTAPNTKITVYNNLGAELLVVPVEQLGFVIEKIDFNPFMRGLYFIKVTVNNHNIVKKVIRK